MGLFIVALVIAAMPILVWYYCRKMAREKAEAERAALLERNYRREQEEKRRRQQEEEKEKAEKERYLREYEAKRNKCREEFFSSHPDAPKYFSPEFNEYYKKPYGFENDDLLQYIAYDIETTGLSPSKDKIIEIAGLKVENGIVIDTFNELVNPEIHIPSDATAVNGITDDMVASCRTIDAVLPDFMKFVGKFPMVAHNAKFDYLFLQVHWERLTGKSFTRKHYCTMEIYRKYFRLRYDDYASSAKLKYAVLKVLGPDYYNEFTYKSHRALIDATAVKDIFELIGAARHSRVKTRDHRY